MHLIKAIATVEGVAEALCPGFDVVDHVRPNIEGLVQKRFGIKAMRRRLKKSAIGYGEALEALPDQLRELFDRLRRSRLAFDVEHRGLEELTDEIESASVNISYALTIAALIVGSSVLVLTNAVGEGRAWITVLAILGYASSMAIAGWRLFRLWLAGR